MSHSGRQEQFLEVIDRDEAKRRFQSHLDLRPLAVEQVPLADCLDRILAEEIIAEIDVPGFDRSNVDGFAVKAIDTFRAAEETPRNLLLRPETLSPGEIPAFQLHPGEAVTIATGSMVPRGADAILMVEYSDIESDSQLQVLRSVTPGEHIAFAGTDIARGETILRQGQVVTSREIGVLAALGLSRISVYRRPRVAILSTGNEIITPGQPLPTGSVYDSNAAILGAAVREAGCEPVYLGIVGDEETQLDERLRQGLQYDTVLLSGGTSKGAGDLSYRVVSRLKDPGIVAHGVALKPGKPICLAVSGGKPVVILPGFPTSAIFTFHEFVAPVLRSLGGRPAPDSEQVVATLPLKINSERGRTEFFLVGLVRGDAGLVAYPMGKGSGSVTTFSQADGFITIDQHTELLEAGASVSVQLLGQRLEPADLVVIGSHCVGLDFLLGLLQQMSVSVKQMNVGSQGGLAAAKRGQCDLAGIHLLDPQTGEYNRPFLSPDLELIPGYRRMQGIVYRSGDSRFAGKAPTAAITAAIADADCTMVNRNAGSGTRLLIDRLLGDARPPGYAIQAKSHNAVAAAVCQKRADWGIAIDTVAHSYGLSFLPLQDEHYDFVSPRSRLERGPVRKFLNLLNDPEVRRQLELKGFRKSSP